MTDKFGLFPSAHHRDSLYKTCPGGNSVIGICGYPCTAYLVCHFLHKVSSGMEGIWHFELSNFEVKYLS